MTPAEALLAQLIAFYSGPGRGGDAAAESVLDRALAVLPSVTPHAIEPRRLPVADLLAEALSLSPYPLASAIAAAAPTFRWRQNPNYNTDNMGAAFIAGYGYAEFVGRSEALFLSDEIRVGLLVLGPGRHYPPHAHPAEEVYTALMAGSWRRGVEPWRVVPPGASIHHPPMIEHETKADRGTLLALYCWIGDTATEARPTPKALSSGGR
ncbi:MAG: hypothetical protein JNN33_17985 [Rhodospirillaceae bacterium]|nr:hypothetical protein [Rhodospirillaceae bacterium]